jgi:hypothetical protein
MPRWAGSDVDPVPSWVCSACTFHNRDIAAQFCPICDSPRDAPAQGPFGPRPGAVLRSVSDGHADGSSIGGGRDDSAFVSTGGVLIHGHAVMGSDPTQFQSGGGGSGGGGGGTLPTSLTSSSEGSVERKALVEYYRPEAIPTYFEEQTFARLVSRPRALGHVVFSGSP